MKTSDGVSGLSRAEGRSAAHAELPKGVLDLEQLVEAVKQTPGCIGVELARTPCGKMAVFAWFENKQGLLNWYHGAAHEAAMKKHFGM